MRARQARELGTRTPVYKETHLQLFIQHYLRNVLNPDVLSTLKRGTKSTATFVKAMRSAIEPSSPSATTASRNKSA